MMETTIKNKQMKGSTIGLSSEYTELLTERLNNLLSDYQLFYMNVRGFHWNIKGEKFFELHAKFEELYDNLQEKIDEIAERVLTLGGTPLHTYTDYLSRSEVEPMKGVSDAKTAVASLVITLVTVIGKQRELLAVTSDAGDEGTNSLMSDYIREQEKLVWMYKAFLS
jgi:starvation-inducible DNA-binding protein